MKGIFDILKKVVLKFFEQVRNPEPVIHEMYDVKLKKALFGWV